MAITSEVRFDATYDVVVLGFGGAGATAARFAADDGAKVLLVDSAPEGHEGGNTRYSAQLIGTGDDFDQTKKYYQNLTAPMNLDEKMIDTFVEGMVNTPKYVKNYLGVEPFSWREHFPEKGGFARNAYEEFPEYDGVGSYDFTTVHPGMFDAALWQNLKQQISHRSQQIDVLYSTPAVELIQDPASKTITGVVIERGHVLRNIQARNGIVLATGGFENNQTMIEDNLGASNLAPLGTLYNKGAGIRMAQEVGADLWHMNNFESLGLLHGMAFSVPKNHRGRLMIAEQNNAVAHGSAFVVGDDGTRYFNEAEENRHGHIKNHGQWKVPLNQDHPYLIFDSAKKKELDADEIIGQYAPYRENIVVADSIEELGQRIDVDPDNLQITLARFNQTALDQNDPEFHRPAETLKAFETGPIYAVRMKQTVLNTQGGPRRNSRAEVLDTKGEPIPHLYSAGELGGICANQYQGGGNLAECLIFGKIAGQNAAVTKEDMPEQVATNSENSTFMITSDDHLKEQNYETGPDQYIGRSQAGIGGDIVVRLTADHDKNLKNIEILQQSESSDVDVSAVKELPHKMVEQNKVDVDAVAGASTSSHALRSAVEDALDQIK